MKRISLTSRIFASYFLLIGLSSAALAWIASNQILDAVETLFFEELADTAESTEELYADLFFSAIDDDRWPDDAELATLGRRIATDFEVSVTVLDESGLEVSYDSAGLASGRLEVPYQEVVLFLEDGELEEMTDEELNFVYQLVPIVDEEDDVIFALIRIGKSQAEYQAVLRNRYAGLIGGVSVAVLVFVGLFGGLLARAITRPLTDLRVTAREMAAGKLETRANTETPSEVGLLAEDFNSMADAVENMMAEQRAFANNAAHELRTPLTAIRLRTETLLEDDPNDELRDRYTAEIHREVQRLGRLIDDLRILSRADSVRMKRGQEQIDLFHLVKSLQREFTPKLGEKGHDFVIHAADQPYMMEGGNSHIRTVLRNLIENGIKYTPDNGRIEVYLERSAEWVAVTVKDNGMGIAADDLPQLFKRFYRVDKAHSRQIPGSGLGLSLVKSIVALYNGEITLHSDGLGKGATVRVDFPLNVVREGQE